MATNSEEISLKDLILRMKEIWGYLLKKWLWIGVVGLVCGGLGLALSFVLKPKYEGKVSFIIENGESGGLGAYAGIASQFGFDLGGGGAGTFSQDNLLELFKSRNIIEDALLSEVSFMEEGESKKDLLINRFLNAEGLQEKLSKNVRLSNVKYELPVTRDKFTLQHDSILYVVYIAIVEDYMGVEEVGDATMLNINCKSKDEIFSKFFVERVVEGVVEMYMNHKTQRAKESIAFIERKADSVKRELHGAELAYAKLKDNSHFMLKAQGYLPEIQLQHQMEILGAMYAEVIKNQEISKMTMLAEQPLVKIIDSPRFPLEKSELKKLKAIVIGGFLGCFLACCFFIARKLYKDMMGEGQEGSLTTTV